MSLDPGHVTWCRHMFSLLAEGGVWGIPRSGILWQKKDGKLVLRERMPWMQGMPITAQELHEQQQEEIEECRAHFQAAGVEVVA